MMDLQEAFDAGFDAVKSYVDRSFDAYEARIEALERRFDALPSPQDGKSVTIEDVAPMIAAEIEKRVAELPPARDGASVTIDDVMPALQRHVDEALSALPLPQDGKSVTIEDVAPMMAVEIEKRIAELPKPKDGNDGIGLAGAFIDRKGELVVTLTNGETRALGPVVGKDGDPGRDGFQLEEFDAAVMDDSRTVLLSFSRGDLEYKVELGFPVMIYRGVYREGEYERGDTVTWGGSLWHCDAPKTNAKPGEGSPDWTLCAKKGRDGKDGVAKDVNPIGSIRVGAPARKD
ncbi:hypothetical protein [Rhizobium sp. SYY.PMSO]|uniref:hypothetical protein n=1 Tax=Rhizobium sp. SYY.PMSO TaxID=3382192 RepID=UPI00398FABE1